jgi:hypothetical protein
MKDKHNSDTMLQKMRNTFDIIINCTRKYEEYNNKEGRERKRKKKHSMN